MLLSTLFTTKKTKVQKSHIMNLIKLAKADGIISRQESNLLIQIGERNGISAAEVFEMVEVSDDFFYKKPANDSERFDQLFDLVEMMTIDGIVDEKEMAYTVEVAEKMGIRKAVAWILVDRLIDGINSGKKKATLKMYASEYLFM